MHKHIVLHKSKSFMLIRSGLASCTLGSDTTVSILAIPKCGSTDARI